MKKVITFFLFVLLVAMVSAQNISNVDFHQVGDEIIVTYELDEASPIGAYVSLDGGKSYEEMHSVQGDIGEVVLPGKKRLIWKVLDDILGELVGQVLFKVSVLTFRQMVKDVEFEMVYVKGGTFMMGATSEQGSDAEKYEKPVHRVTLSDYYIGKFEVTQGLWKKVMGNNPDHFKKGDNYPMEHVKWKEAVEFCTKLSKLTGRRYTLPTEAQWEYAARGGAKSKGYKYSGSNDIAEVAWYAHDHKTGKIRRIPIRVVSPVGTKKANELGIYDMSGNVCEWCKDWNASYSSEAQINPAGPNKLDGYHVNRGGDICSKEKCRVSSRSWGYVPPFRYGLRVVCIP